MFNDLFAERVNHMPHNRNAGYRVIPFDVSPEGGDGHSDKRMRSVSEWQNHPMHGLLLRQKIGEPRRSHRRSGDSIIFFQFSAVFGDRRRATVSATDAEYYGVTPPLQLGPEIRLVRKHISRLPHHRGLHRRHPPGKPSLHLFKKFISPAKAYIHKVDCFAIERAKPGSQWRRLYRVSGLTCGVQNRMECFTLCHQSSSPVQRHAPKQAVDPAAQPLAYARGTVSKPLAYARGTVSKNGTTEITEQTNAPDRNYDLNQE